MIDYASWQAPKAETSKTEPSVLSPAQRQIFWMIVSGRSLVSIAEEIGRSHRTVEAHKYEIERRIPGLLGLACYGMLAVEIIRGSGNETQLGVSVQSAIQDSAVGIRKREPQRRGAFP